ncbi:zinc ribbon domain-containing protein [Streptomyces sp. NPDC005283]|uniref:zinc ribbon domain-containing protein n=1 Tax=Streptomyces sp. NPDC005283 TaxID=3156871 RepID=UPI003454B777
MPRLYSFDDSSRRRLRDSEVGPLRQAVSRRRAGQSTAEVAAWMTAEGYVGTLGSPFTSMTLGRLFKNPAIAGCAYDDSGRLVDAGHPGAIERQEFVELQKSLAESKTAGKTPAYEYLLSGGLSRCGNCQQELSGARTNAGNPGYRCRPKEKDGRGGCGTVRIDALLLETHVAEYVVAELSKPGVRAQIERAGRRVAKQAEEFREEIQGLEKRRTDLAGPYARGEIRLDAFKAADQEITGQVKALRSRLRYAEQMASFSLGGVKDLVRWWNHAPFGSKRALAMLLLEKVEVFSARDRGVREIEPGRVKLHWRKLS